MPQCFRFFSAGILLVGMLVALGGCNDDSNSASTSGTAESRGGDAAIVIAGAPASSVTVGESYSFQPSVTAPPGAALNFSIANQPSWAKFDSATGELTGLPTAGDAGDFANIVITVDDGAGKAALAPFAIRVGSGSSAVATITWTAPALAATPEPAGYRVYYGTSAAGMIHVAIIDDPRDTSYVVENLSPGTWYFAIASYDQNETQSTLSPTVSVTL
jgi:hypothetical protein